MQQVSRKTGISMEKLTMKLRVLQQGEEMLDTKAASASNSYYLDGFWLNGARWSAKHHSIDEMLNNYVYSTKLPIIHLSIHKFDASKLGAESGSGIASKLAKGYKQILSKGG